MIPSISPEADRELSHGAVYYAQEGNPDLGLAFIAELERAINLLCTRPQLGAPWRGRRRFPYSIIYYLKGDELRVIALAHHRRRPGYWAGRQ